MAIQLIALDIDGTLLNSKNELTGPTRDALQQAAGRGIHIVLGTGRMVSECRELLARTKDFALAVIQPDPAFLGDTISLRGDGAVTDG